MTYAEKHRRAIRRRLWADRSRFGRKPQVLFRGVPQAWIEFDVADIEKATAELKSQGYQPLIATRTEPWGQIVTRLLGPEGLLVGFTHTPSMRK
jgi:hypothetical protein